MSWPALSLGPIATSLPGGFSGKAQQNTLNYVQGVQSAALVPLASIFSSSDVSGIRGDTIPPWNGQAYLSDSPTTDMRYRFYQVPEEIRLVNPPLGSDLIYFLWNTWPMDQVLNTQVVSDPEVVVSGFDLLDEAYANQYLTATYQLGQTNTDIDATISLGFTDETVIIAIFGAIASTFTLIPDVPVREEWIYQTDVLQSFDNTEQRVALRKNPRRKISFDVELLDFRQRREQYITLFRNLGQAATVPQFMHGTRLSQNTPAGVSTVFFDPELTVMQAGEPIVFLNPYTEAFEIGTIVTVNADGATLSGNLSVALTTDWLAFPAISYLLSPGSGIQTLHVTGSMKVSGDSLSFPSILRDNAVPVINKFRGLPVMERKMRGGGMAENFSRRTEEIDFETGIIEVEKFADDHAVVSGIKRWTINRYDRVAEDYMRAFIDGVRGAQKAFFLPTWMRDMELVSAPGIGAGVLNVTLLDFETFFSRFESWENIMLQYETLSPTYHQVTSTVAEDDGTLSLVLDPPLQPGSEDATRITCISFLNRVRGDDRIQRSHGLTSTVYSWVTRTVDE